ASIDTAYEEALASDPVSAYGGVVALNRTVPGPVAERITEQFVEVLSAPGYEPKALAAFAAKPAVRVLAAPADSDTARLDVRSALGGLLVQERDGVIDKREGMEIVCG